MGKHSITKKLMGSVFELVIIHEDGIFANQCLQAGINEIVRLEKKLSEFDPSSTTSAINKNAGIKPVNVDDETFSLLKRCIQLSMLTQGAFDITASSLKKLYNFKNDERAFPLKNEIQSVLKTTGYQNIELTEGNNVFLKNSGMRINFAAIGKGYAADAVKSLWKNIGVKNGVVNASGDLTVLGKNSQNENWIVGIADPDNSENILFQIPMVDSSIATSGNYEQFFTSRGKKYSHNIDPKSGKPLTGVKSASIISPNAELSDALATAISVLGVDVGMHLINQLPDTHAIMINKKNEIFQSDKINILKEATRT